MVVRQLLAQFPSARVERFGCYRIPDHSPFSDLARSLECAVFQEFFGNAPEIMTEAYAAYERSSWFLLVVDHDHEQPAGALRVIANSESGLKSLNDVAVEPLCLPSARVRAQHGIADLDRCWDAGTLAVAGAYRGKVTDHLVSTMLYGRLYSEMYRCHIEHLVAILDKHAHRQLTDVLAVPFIPLLDSPPFSYLGSLQSRAVHLRLASVRPSMESHARSLDDNTRRVVWPYLARILDAEGLPPLVHVR